MNTDQERERKKRILRRYKKNKNMIARLKNKVSEIEDRIDGLKSPVISDMPRGGVPVTKTDLMGEKIDIEARIVRLEEKGKRLKKETIDLIDEYVDDPRYADILEGFFVDCLNFDEIAIRLGYHERHIERLYAEAIDTLSF